MTDATTSLDRTLRDAVTLHQAGRLGEAEELYRSILNQCPDHIGSLYHLGLIARRAGSPALAAALIRRALTLEPDLGEAQNNLGNVFMDQGWTSPAVIAYARSLVLDPNLFEARGNLGGAFLARKQGDVAVKVFRSAAVLRPAHAETLNSLGIALKQLARLVESTTAYGRALVVTPDYPEAGNNLGNVFNESGRRAVALASYRRTLVYKPDYAEAWSNYGAASSTADRPNLAASLCQRAVALKPSDAKARNNLGIALKGSLDDAIFCFRVALVLSPDDPDTYCNLGSVLQDHERLDEAVAFFRLALRLKPDFPEALSNLGVAWTMFGRFDEAGRAIEQAIALAPRKAAYYRYLALARRFSADDPMLSAMAELARDIESLSDDDRIELQFALGKVYEDLGQSALSFRYLMAGNAMQRRTILYDETATLAEFERIRAVFTTDLIKNGSAAGNSDERPVFIVGMPRSGTTLVEQILASHSHVFGAGELDLFGRTTANIVGNGGFPEAVTGLSAEDLQDLGKVYFAGLRSRTQGKEPVITDKNPYNFLYCGLIHLSLPNARIIHTRRDPIDTCLSCFSKLFPGGQYQTYDLAELGRYYRAYESLMKHWRRVLPEETMLEVDYEEVVADLEGQARRLVAHCGLTWEDACLAFHKTERAVKTASATQVRRPIYKTSVGRWRPDADLLRPLIEALGAK